MTHVERPQRNQCMTTFHPQAIHLRSRVQLRQTATRLPLNRGETLKQVRKDFEYRVQGSRRRVQGEQESPVTEDEINQRLEVEKYVQTWLPESQREPVAGCPGGTGTPPCRQWLACRAQALQEAGACAAAVAVPLPDRSARAIRLDRREGSLHFVWKPAQSHLMLRQK